MEVLREASKSLFALCAVAAGMDLILGDGRAASAFRSVCALAVATGTVRLLLELIGAAQ